jgi:hypothetical protein
MHDESHSYENQSNLRTHQASSIVTPEEPADHISLKKMLVVLAPFLVGIIAILPRLSFPFYNGEYLWAEDGSIYINQARSLGVSSLWTPYAGYLQTYSRLIALIGNIFPLRDIPSIYIVGWFFAFFVTIYVIRKNFVALGYRTIGIVIAIAAVFLQPNCGEVFFNNVNAQWLIGLALAVYIITLTAPSQTVLGIFGTFVASVSGPFSIIYIPIILYKIRLRDNLLKYWAIYSATILGALVQAFFIVKSPRASLGKNFSLPLAIKLFFGILTFGAHGLWLIPILIFWFTFGYLLFTSGTHERSTAILFLLAGLGVWSASIYSASSYLSLFAGVVFPGDRYTFIPYATFILAYLAVIRDNIVSYFIISACLLPFFCYQVVPISYSLGLKNLNFDSYVDFSQNANHIIIPINPVWPTYPGWYISGSLFFHHNQRYNNQRYKPVIISFNAAHVLARGDSLTIKSPTMWCAKSNYIGIESVLYHAHAGWVEADLDGPLDNHKSLRRFYPSGYITAQFAFPYRKYSSMSLTTGSPTPGNIKSISVFCPNLRLIIINKKFNPIGSLAFPVDTNGTAKPLPLFNGQQLKVSFIVPKDHKMLLIVKSVSVFQGNYGNTADGKLEVTACNNDVCSKGSKSLKTSQDNSFFTIPLDFPLTVAPGNRIVLIFKHVDGNKPDALWTWPEKAGYPQELSGPQGPIPGKAIRIALNYQIQEQK